MRRILLGIVIVGVCVSALAFIVTDVDAREMAASYGSDFLLLPDSVHGGKADSAAVAADSLHEGRRDSAAVAADSVKQPYVVKDSTYLEQLSYQRPEAPSAQPFPVQNPFYLKTPPVVQRTVMLDSTGKYVIVTEKIDNKDVKIPIKMPLNEYVAQRSKNDFAKNFAEMIAKEDAGVKKKNDLAELLGSFTNIDIPIPANPVFSIFGPPRINLIISGAVDIRAAFRNTTTDQQTTSVLGNSRNEPDFAQEVQINVNGTIGDKLNILADWNTQRTFEYENQLKIKYTGYEDEIVQSVEAGNVSLATNSSFVSSSSALFGIKAGFQIGPLKLTAIASQKKGQIQEKTVTGGAQEKEFTIRAWQYSKDHFFVDTVYRSLFEPYIKDRQLVRPELQIKDNEFEVWVTHIGQEDPTSRQANAFIDLPLVAINDSATYKPFRSPTVANAGTIETGLWDRLDPIKDYDLDLYGGYMTMKRSIQDGQAIAIAYRIENGAGSNDDLIYGTLTKNESGSDSVLVLKLIKPRNLLPQHTVAWSLMMKNIYFLGGSKVQKAGFSLDIKYDVPGQDPINTIESTRWLRVFGFDDYSGDGSSKDPDGEFDYRPFYTIDEERGEIIFPTLEPFTNGINSAFSKFTIKDSASKYIYNNLYDTLSSAAQNNGEKDRFLIVGKTTASSSNTINLGFNIVEGSVQVLLDGRPLTPNVDYTVDYIIGQVIIKNQAALVPGANMQIKFEQNDLFQLASKTLLGMRGEMKLSDKTQFGFTILNLDQQTLSDKVRLGEEPINNSIYGFDGQTSGELPFVTKAIDAIPFIDTKAKSEFTLRGEAAYMSPDPNTKKSTIADDNGKSIAYIDDFEGAKRIIPLGVGYGLWHDMSPPAYQSNVDPSLTNLTLDTAKIKSKGRTYWYNLSNSVTVNDIYGYDANGNPVKSAARGQEFVTVLNLNYNPRVRGEFNYSDNLRQTLLAEPAKNWGGIQRLISTSAVDLVRENVNFIEVWVRIEKGSIDSTKKVYIDLGTISEDVIPNGKLDTEDKGSFKNGILNEGEDTGMDGLTDDEERAKYAGFLQSNQWGDDLPNPSGDPSGDNWVYSLEHFDAINGTEKNATSEIGRYPDTEDLNRNNVIDRANNYYEYELNLDTTAANPQRIGGGWKGWYQYRIPIIDFKNKIGTPDFSLIEFARVWFTGRDDEVELRLAEFNLIGNQWEELVKNDSSFNVSVVNYEDNSLQGYSIPPGVYREKDRTKPDENILGNEQSLALNFTNLKDGQVKQAIKRYSYRPLDVFSYKEMKMFVHGDTHFATTADKATAKVFIRFGSDSSNYYEYKTPIYPGWDRNNININFEDLTSIKQGRDSTNVRVVIPVKGGPDSATYAVLGNPSLTKITTIYIGIENPDGVGTTDPITGQVWVNELRLVDVDDTPGWAYSVSASAKLADFGALSFTFSEVDPYFHGLESRFGGRTTTRNWSIASSFSLEKFFPQDWTGTSLPFNYTHAEQIVKPKYLQSSDIVVEKAADLAKEKTIAETHSETLGEQEKQKIISESQSVSTTDTYSMPSFKFNVPSNSWFFQTIFNRIGYGFNYTSSTQRSNILAFRKSWQWNAQISYGYTFSPTYYLQPFAFFDGIPIFSELKDLQLYYFPISNINTGFNINRSRAYEKLRTQTQENNPVRGLSARRNLSFGWKLTEGGLLNLSGDYSVDISSSLVHLEVDRFGRQRDFQQILERIFFQDQLVNFGYDNSYNQSVNVNTKPRMPAIFDLNKYITLSARYSVTYRWQNNLQQGDRGIGVGWGNSISFGTDVSLKSFVESWFPAAPASQNAAPGAAASPRSRGNRNDEEVEESRESPPDTPKDSPKDTTAAVPGKKSGEGVIGIARILIKTPFLDYDKVNINFTQTNSVTNAGVPGRPGFANLFGRVPFVQEADPHYGPSRAYQLGLVSVPSANITDVFVKGQFPFVGFSTDAYKQIRAKGSSMSDGFSQSNKITVRTSRELWTGARIDFNWNLGWDYSRNQNITADSITGRVRLGSVATGGSIERSFFTMPPTFLLSMFKSGIDDVGKKYTELITNTADTRSEDEKLAAAFEEGMESLPLLKKIFGSYFPRLNYSLRWDGLEQMSIFKKFATRVSLDHAYQSSYRTSFKGSSGSATTTQSQRIMYGFAPLIGLNLSFKELLKGTMSANVRYSSNVSYDLTPSAKNITESGANELSLTASFARQGFEIPLFGLALQNDVDISFTYSYAKNSRTTYDTKGGVFNATGTPGEGSSRTQMEPRIRYVLSSRVTAAVFYRYTKIAPDAGGSRIPGSTTNEGGLDVHIAIQ